MAEFDNINDYELHLCKILHTSAYYYTNTINHENSQETQGSLLLLQIGYQTKPNFSFINIATETIYH